VKELGEIDLSLQKIGFEHVDDQTDVILEHLRKNKGFLNLSDNSSPEEIQARMKMSKKVFKKAIGILYRQKKIRIENEGIYFAGR
jgi:predicted RNA-binding protein (virulence factor B family)